MRSIPCSIHGDTLEMMSMQYSKVWGGVTAPNQVERGRKWAVFRKKLHGLARFVDYVAVCCRYVRSVDFALRS